jgi:hypothetical protein
MMTMMRSMPTKRKKKLLRSSENTLAEFSRFLNFSINSFSLDQFCYFIVIS